MKAEKAASRRRNEAGVGNGRVGSGRDDTMSMNEESSSEEEGDRSDCEVDEEFDKGDGVFSVDVDECAKCESRFGLDGTTFGVDSIGVNVMLDENT